MIATGFAVWLVEACDQHLKTIRLNNIYIYILNHVTRIKNIKHDFNYFEVDAIEQLLHRGGFGLPPSPPPPCLLGLHLLFIHDVHINELEGAHFTVKHPHPGAHGWLTDDVNDVTTLTQRHQHRLIIVFKPH